MARMSGGKLTLLCHHWIFLERWEKVHAYFDGGRLRFQNSSICGTIDLWSVHTFKICENSVNMMEIRTQNRIFYFFADTERERDIWLNLIGKKLFNFGFEDESSVKDRYWERRAPAILLFANVRKKMCRQEELMQILNYYVSEGISSPNRRRFQQELLSLRQNNGFASLIAISMDANKTLIRLIVSFL